MESNAASDSVSASHSNSSPASSEQSPTRPGRSRGLWLKILGGTIVFLILASGAGAYWFFHRYDVADEMTLPIETLAGAEYPEDPSTRAAEYGQYPRHRLRMIKRGHSTFDFILESDDPKVAQIAIKGVDTSLFVTSLPEWAKSDPGIELIALTDREWNRQQVAFDRGSDQVKIAGGDGFERERLKTVSIAKNCLNAGLWEILLFADAPDGKQLYYQGWFTFPMGHYKAVFERSTGLSYWSYWRRLEHWIDPEGTRVPLNLLREVVDEHDAPFQFDPNEPIIAHGEQIRKRKNVLPDSLNIWQDFTDGQHEISFATFVPPGRYDRQTPWGNEYWRMAKLKGVKVRHVKPAGSISAGDDPLLELELTYESSKDGALSRYLIGGIDRKALKPLPIDQYPDGAYLPMGIAVPPFYQNHEDLLKNPPTSSPYYCVWLDDQEGWINHHDAGIDGPVLHLDADDPNKLNLYLLSYERQTLVTHIVIDLPETNAGAPAETEAAEAQ